VLKVARLVIRTFIEVVTSKAVRMLIKVAILVIKQGLEVQVMKMHRKEHYLLMGDWELNLKNSHLFPVGFIKAMRKKPFKSLPILLQSIIKLLIVLPIKLKILTDH
jgi:hypothetical protein